MIKRAIVGAYSSARRQGPAVTAADADADTTLNTARAYAEQAAAVAARLKPGTYEAVQALALTSIAHT